MTHNEIALAASPQASPPAGAMAREVAQTVKLALPMALTQLGQIAMFTIDLALIGRLGGEAVASVALAHTAFFGAFVCGLGIVSAVSPLAAQSFGARQPRMVRRSVRAGLWAAVLAALPFILALRHGESALLALGEPSGAAHGAGLYLLGLCFSLAPSWIFMVLRNFMGAVNRPEPALWITLSAIPLNALIAYALIFGAFGLPRLGLLGAGIGTAIVNSAMCVAAFAIAYAMHPFKKYRILGRFWRFDTALFLKLLRLGIPISGAFLLEFAAFAAAALLMGRIGTVALAAHQIAVQVASILFMAPFGVSMAATVRVGHAVGEGKAPEARRAGLAAIGVAIAFAFAMTGAVVALRHVIPALFLGVEAPLAPETQALASALLLIGATFFIADAVQTVAAGALRGLNDTRMPLVFAFVSFWIVGISAGYGLAFEAEWGATGIWVGLSLGLSAYAGLLLARFLILTRGGRNYG